MFGGDGFGFYPFGVGVNCNRQVCVALVVGWEGSSKINRPSLTRGGGRSGLAGWFSWGLVGTLGLAKGTACEYLGNSGTLVWPLVLGLQQGQHFVTPAMS